MSPVSQSPLNESTLPSLGVTVSRIIALYSDADHTVDSVLRILETDPAVTARILRLANSAYFGFSSRVSDLQRAVVLLGSVTVQAVALAANILNAWGGQGPPEEVEALWVHSYLCATASRLLGLRLPPDPHRSSPDVLFVHGLLAQVGRLLFLNQTPEEYAALLQQYPDRQELCRQEIELYGWDHAEAGATLLETWRLPPRIAAVVRYQYRGRLREELQPDRQVLNAATATCGAEPLADNRIPVELLRDLETLVQGKRPEAQAFYAAIS